MIYVTLVNGLNGSDTVYAEPGLALGAPERRDALQRAINRGRVALPGRYVVASPSDCANVLNASIFEVEENRQPTLRIAR